MNHWTIEYLNWIEWNHIFQRKDTDLLDWLIRGNRANLKIAPFFLILSFVMSPLTTTNWTFFFFLILLNLPGTWEERRELCNWKDHWARDVWQGQAWSPCAIQGQGRHQGDRQGNHRERPPGEEDSERDPLSQGLPNYYSSLSLCPCLTQRSPFPVI